jgi:gluconolactonase
MKQGIPMKSALVVIVIAFGFVLVGCGGGSSGSKDASSTTTSVSLNSSSTFSVIASSLMRSISSVPASSAAVTTSSLQSTAASSAKLSSASSNNSSVATSPCGNAPSGNLVAERIQSANSTRSEASLYEGAVWINGALYFSDFTFSSGYPSRIQKLELTGAMTTFKDDTGSNGLAVDAQGNIVAGTHKYKSISRFSITTGARTSVAETYNGNVFNSPNDIVIAKDGTLYFTDPDFQKSAAPGGQGKTNVFRVATDSVVSVIDSNIYNPNGISLSPDGDVLYVSGGGDPGVLRAYTIVNGEVKPGIDIVTDLKGPDGMTVDCHGNIYATEHAQKRIRVFTPAGTQIATVSVDANVTNVAFGGALGKTLFITGAGAIWKLELDVTGSPY